MAQKVMYPGMVNSPETTITNGISESDTIIYVLDPTRVPEPPNLMTLGTGTNAETVKVTEINGSAITVERGFQGIAKSWPAGTVIARNFTEYDYNALKENIEDLAELAAHAADNVRHITSAERTTWNEKQNALGYTPVNKSGDEMTGILTAHSNTSYTVRQVRNIILSNADADLGAMQNGDIWIKYK